MKSRITEYICYCWFGNTSPSFTGTATNTIDAACRDHDIGYGRCKFGQRYELTSVCFTKIYNTGLKFCVRASEIHDQFVGASRLYIDGIIGIFYDLGDRDKLLWLAK